MNVIFMGTPEFGVPSLKALIDSESHKVVAVFSSPPKPQGRGMKITESPVHKLANSYNIPVYTPSTLRDDSADKLIKSIKADIIIVVAYGFIIPKNILEAKKYGSLNIHPSKLPKYRGAAPLQRTIINLEKETAVCIMQMDEGLDTGDILMERVFQLTDEITLTNLHDKCAKIGALLLLQVLDKIDTIVPQKQSNGGIIYAHKLSKQESKIDWNQGASMIDAKVRGMNPWPGVYFEYDGKKIKILKSEVLNIEHNYQAGLVLQDRADFFEVACGSGILRILTVQPEGKKSMDAKDYERGLQGGCIISL